VRACFRQYDAAALFDFDLKVAMRLHPKTLPRLARCAILCLLAVTSACAPGLGERFSVDTVETVSIRRSNSDLEGLRLRWGTFTDARSSAPVATINGRELLPSGDIGASAQRVFEAQFKEAGLRRGLFEGLRAEGQVLEWHIDITPGFPATKMEARASIRLSLSDEGGKSLYAARYTGVVMSEHPIGSTDRIERTFSLAMAEAAAEALADPEFVRAVRVAAGAQG
jgi:hypothetical protein